MHTIEVNSPGGRYAIQIGSGALQNLPQAIPTDASSIIVVSDSCVWPLYGAGLKALLAGSHKPILEVVLPAGEANKTWTSLDLIFDQMLAFGADRKAVMIAVGGGVVGDICGFAAACYMRGVRFIQVPTTLLAQVDSSVGGKTAINHPRGKNMLGAFYQPLAVLIDTDVLRSLPAREISAGLAEVIKYGLIADAEFFAWCERHAAALRRLQMPELAHAIGRSCELKAWVVSQDERESGLRAILNFGHTFAHAIEAGLGYGQWLHGEAVGCGMVLAAELSAQELGLPAAVVGRTKALVEAIGCPVLPPDLGTARWLELMRADKKSEARQIRYILLPDLGAAALQAVPDERVSKLLERLITGD